MSGFSSIYQPVTSQSFYSAVNDNKNLEMYKVTDQYLQKYATSACKSKEWDSLPFQEFVKVFMGENTPYNSILITWGTGVGKTCGAVQITEALRSAVQMFNKSIYIIAPANLQQNYKETLLSECSGNRIPADIDPKLRDNYISKTYRFYSYIKFGRLIEAIIAQSVKNQQDPRQALLKKFSNCVFVIDEAHNLNNLKEDAESKEELKKSKKTAKKGKKKVKNDDSDDSDDDNPDKKDKATAEEERRLLNTLQYLFGSIKNSKLILLTATPVRNHINEIVSLMDLLRLNNGQAPIDENIAFGNGININYLLSQIKGYVSYVRGNSQISFPRIDNAGEIIQPYPSHDPAGKNLQYGMHLTKVIPCELYFLQLAFYLWYLLFQKSSRGKDRFESNLETISDVVLPVLENGVISPANITKKATLMNYVKYNATTETSELTRLGCLYEGDETIENTTIEQSFFLCKRFLPYVAVKLDKLLDNLLQEGVHYVYSRLVEFGTNIISIACQLYGWDCIKVNSNNEITYKYTITPNEHIIKRCWCGKLEHEHVGDHPFSQGHILLYTGKTNTNQKVLQNILAIVNSDKNKRGELCKVFIGSRVSGEGVNYRRLRYVHIMEPWWNNTVLQQVIGRAARNCSHFDLPRNQQNVIVYKYAAIFPKSLESIVDIFPNFVTYQAKLQRVIDQRETVDEMIYRIAESKDIEIAYLTRLLKMSAVDCENNYIWNRIWTEAEIQQLRRSHQFKKNDKVYHVNDEAIDLLNVGEDGSPECEYMNCDYDCMSDQPLAHHADDTVLYSYINVNKQKIVVKINQIIEFIQTLHTPMFSLGQLLEYFNVNIQQNDGYTKFDYYNIFDAITEMLTNQNVVFEWQGMTGRLVLYETKDGIIYMFDAFARYIEDPTLIPQYFKFNNVFTNGSNVRINMNFVNDPDISLHEHTTDTINYINQANEIINANEPAINKQVKICELLDNMNNSIYHDVMLTPFNLMVEYLDTVNNRANTALQQFIDWYLVENYRTSPSGLNVFYISWSNITYSNSNKALTGEIDENGKQVVGTVYDWTVEFYCRYKIAGIWKYYKVVYYVKQQPDPFAKINFSSLNINFIVQEQRLSDVYYDNDDEYIREHIGSILTETLNYYNETGIKNASTQAAYVYEYFASSMFRRGFNIRIVNATRGNVKQNKKLDKRSISTGQDCTTAPMSSLETSLEQVADQPEMAVILNEIKQKVYDNSEERCRTLAYAFRKLDLQRRAGLRWFYMYGNYDLFNYHM